MKVEPRRKVNISQGLTFQAAALMRAQKDDVKVDVVMMDEVAATQVAAEGLSVPLSEPTVPNLLASIQSSAWPVTAIRRWASHR